MEFKLPAVCASAFEIMSSEASILPKHIFEGKNTFDINMLEEEVVGAGPYVLEEYKTGQYLKFKRIRIMQAEKLTLIQLFTESLRKMIQQHLLFRMERLMHGSTSGSSGPVCRQ